MHKYKHWLQNFAHILCSKGVDDLFILKEYKLFFCMKHWLKAVGNYPVKVKIVPKKYGLLVSKLFYKLDLLQHQQNKICINILLYFHFTETCWLYLTCINKMKIKSNKFSLVHFLESSNTLLIASICSLQFG